MLPLGTAAPDFALTDTEGNTVTLSQYAEAKGLLVMFICNHCPYVIHLRDELARIGRDYQPQGLGVVSINSNDVENYPDDSPENMAREVATVGYTFPYLFDGDQSVALAYHAACTPDFFLFDADLKLVYRGQLDGSRPNSGTPVTGEDLRAAIDAVLSGGGVSSEQRPSMGCSIKWKAGNAPA
jgi:peroxiredoxin